MAKTPTITSHSPHSTVHSRLLLASGTCGPSSSSGHVWVSAHNYNFPPQSYPVRDGQFKALIHLSPGPNNIRLDFNEASSSHDGRYNTYTGGFSVNYLPLLQNPPLHLAIIVGSDSKCCYDDVPDCATPPTLDAAARRLRMAAYMWQAYTGTQMHAHKFGHRTFRLDEAWLPDTLTTKDSKKRTTAKITILRSKYSTKHIRDPARAQQNKAAKSANGANSLFGIAMEAIEEYPEWRAGRGGEEEKIYVAAMFLDAKYESGMIKGHAALGGGTDKVGLAIFGSHMLFSWPGAMEEVVPCFNDARPVNTKHCGIDAEGSTYWMAANVGIGAFMHEVGHLLGCPHQPHGVMLRDYPRLNRAFSVVQPPSGGTQGRECEWHRFDALRFRCHPCFALSSDPPIPGSISLASVDDGILVSAPAGLLLVEFRVKGGGEHPKAWLEFPDNPPTTYIISPRYLVDHVSKHFDQIGVKMFALNNAQKETTDISPLLTVGVNGVRRSMKHGSMTGGTPVHTLLPPAMRHIRIYSGSALDGLEFFPLGNGPSVLFGSRGGSPKEFPLHPGEMVLGFGLRYGGWVDAVQIVTDRRRSEWFGGTGGGAGEAIVPQGYRLSGVWGEMKQWVMGIGIEYCRN